MGMLSETIPLGLIIVIWLFIPMTCGLVIPDLVDNTRFIQGESLPDHIELDIPGTVKLRLRRSTSSDLNRIPLYVVKNGHIRRKNLATNQTFEVYTNPKKMAAMSISCRGAPGEQCDPKVSGTFEHNNNIYQLEPSSQGPGPVGGLPLSSRRKRETENQHRVRRRTDVTGKELDDSPSELVSIQVREVETPNSNIRGKRAGPKINYGVELVAVVAYDLYNKWYSLSSESSASAKELDTLENIRRFFALVASGIDMRYANIDVDDFNLFTKLTAFVILQTALDSEFTEKNKQPNNQIESTVILPAFRRWASAYGPRIVRHDHLQLYTQYDVLGYGDTRTVGLAYIGSVCYASWAVSLIEDRQDIMKTTTIGAHELGHCLGAYHDGVSNACPTSSNYVMTTQVGRAEGTSKYNPWKFSSCSITYFRRMLKVRNRYPGRCLLDQPQTIDPAKWELYTKHLPGQLYNVDEQCRLIYDQSSFMCRSVVKNAADICTSMWCFAPSADGSSRVCSYHVAARGTTCGPNKWCIDGQCVFSNDAPRVAANCIFGDDPSEIFRFWTCNRLIRAYPILCQWNFYGVKEKCCGSCSSTRRKRSVDEEWRIPLSLHLRDDMYYPEVSE